MKRVVYARRGGLEAIEIIDEENPTPEDNQVRICLLYTSPSPRDVEESRMPSSA